MRRSTAVLGLLLTLAAAPPTLAAPTAVRFGTLWDGKGGILKNAVVVVEGDRIQSVGTGAPPAGMPVVDLSRYTGLPGLIDVHTHMTYGPAPGGGRAPAVNMVLGQDAARKTLEAGVTTVRDMNAAEYMDVALRDLIASGAVVGPRMFVVGYGLHITRTRTGLPATPGTVDGPDAAMRVAREQIAAGADWVKMFGSTGSGQDVTGQQTFTYEEMKAAVDATHALGKRIAVHSYGPAGARDAVRAGADSVEHATDMDEATIAEMARRGTFYVPTIDHNRYYAENGDRSGYAAGYRERLEDFERGGPACPGRLAGRGVARRLRRPRRRRRRPASRRRGGHPRRALGHERRGGGRGPLGLPGSALVSRTRLLAVPQRGRDQQAEILVVELARPDEEAFLVPVAEVLELDEPDRDGTGGQDLAGPAVGGGERVEDSGLHRALEGVTRGDTAAEPFGEGALDHTILKRPQAALLIYVFFSPPAVRVIGATPAGLSPDIVQGKAVAGEGNGAPRPIRTGDLQIRSLLLYPAELGAHGGQPRNPHHSRA